MSEGGVLPGLWPIPGDGVLARQGDLVLLIHPAGGAFTDRLLDLLAEAARVGEGGRRFAELVSAAFDADADATDTADDEDGPAAVAFGPAGGGTAVTVYGTAWAEVTTTHGMHRLTAGQPYGRLRCILPSRVIKVRAGVHAADDDSGTDPYLRLADGVVRAVGLVYAPEGRRAGAADPGEQLGHDQTVLDVSRSEQAAAEQAAAEQAAPERAAAEQAAAEQAAAERAAAEQAAAEQAAAERAATEQAAAERAAAEQAAAEQAAAERAAAERAAAERAAAERAAAERAAAERAAAERAAAEQEAAERAAAERAAAEWAAAEQAAAERQAAEQAAALAEPAVSGRGDGRHDISPRRDFISLSLISDTTGGGLPVRDPLPLGAEPPDEQGLGTAAAVSPLVEGVYCKNGHFNDPEARFCAVCGIGMGQLTKVRQKGKRPPLGVLVLADGSVCQLDADYVMGREPTLDTSVADGRARPLRLIGASEVVSRIHARVELDSWQVYITDLNSANGTQIIPPGERNAIPLQPGVRAPLVAGAQIQLGGEYGLRYDSHRHR